MDKNKLEKLRELKYSIRKCCGLCENSKFNFLDCGNAWGICMIHRYEHLKHTEVVRELSINQFGHCDDFKWNNSIKNIGLKDWIEFLEK